MRRHGRVPIGEGGGGWRSIGVRLSPNNCRKDGEYIETFGNARVGSKPMICYF